MFLIDLEQGRIIDDEELKANIVNTKPYTAVDREHRIARHIGPGADAVVPTNC